MKIRFLSAARRDVLDATRFYEEQAPGLGADFLEDLDRALDLLASSPRVGSSFEGDTRRLLLHRFPYALIYAIEAGSVVIVAVAHQRRRPGFWQDRED